MNDLLEEECLKILFLLLWTTPRVDFNYHDFYLARRLVFDKHADVAQQRTRVEPSNHHRLGKVHKAKEPPDVEIEHFQPVISDPKTWQNYLVVFASEAFIGQNRVVCDVGLRHLAVD